MKPAKPSNPSESPQPGARRGVRVVCLGKLKPLTAEGRQRMREAARDPKLTTGRKFPTIKD